MNQATQLTIDNAHARATISLYGGQVLSYIPKRDGRERLFVSSKALLDGSKSIRGGVPLCWPWFGAWKGAATPTPMPAHGYARNRQWQVVSMVEAADATVLTLALPDASGHGFAHAARLEAVITVGPTLSVALQTTNTGTTPFALSTALHTYFAIDDIRQLQLAGLHGDYSDKTLDWAILPTPVPYTFAAETDRIHLQPVPTVDIMDKNNTIRVASIGHDSIVVWNPWEDGSKAFSDLDANDYIRFVCVETALTQGFTLQAGATHCLQQSVS